MNRYQNALDRLICNIGVAKSNYIKSGKAEEDIKDIQELVDYQKPMKPILIGDYGKIYYELWSCPNCLNKYPSETGEYKYCPKCGQRIDWDMEEE